MSSGGTMTSSNQMPSTVYSSSSIKPSNILTIILILSATVLISISLCLLLRHINRRCLLHLSSSASAVSPEDDPPPPPAAAAAAAAAASSSSLLDSLPIFTFASLKRLSSSPSEGDCAVCLSKFEGEDRLRLLPLCCHAFHVECIDTWLGSNQTCPLCRSPLLASDSDLLRRSRSRSRSRSSNSFRVEMGSVSRRRPDGEHRSSYSLGSSLEYYVMEEEHWEVTMGKEEGRGMSWLKEYVDRLSSRAMSLSLRRSSSGNSIRRSSSGRFLSGSSGRSDHLQQQQVAHIQNQYHYDEYDDLEAPTYSAYSASASAAAAAAAGDHIISEMFRCFSAL